MIFKVSVAMQQILMLVWNLLSSLRRCDMVLGLRVQIPAAPLSSATLGKLLTHMCLCHQAV